MEYFARVAEEKSIAKVAKQFHVVPSTVSTQIKSLEEELGTMLFYRTSNAMILTENGQMVYEYVFKILALANSAVNELKDRNHALQTINLYVETCPLTFTKIIKGFKNLYPDISWNLIQTFSKPAHNWNTSSLQLHATEQPLERPNSVTLFQEECLIGACARNPLAKQKTIHLEDIRDQHFIMRSPLSVEINHLIDQSLRAAHFSPSSYDCCDNSFLLNEMVAKDMGLAFLPFLTWLHYNDPDIVLLRVPELHIVRYINLTWNGNLYLSQSARAFISYAKEYFSSLQKTLALQSRPVTTIESFYGQQHPL